MTDDAKAFIAREAYDPVYGARPLKRFLQQHVETPVARHMIAGEFAAGSTVKVEVKSGALAIS